MAAGINLGLLAYSSNTGLGIQTHEFAAHLKPDRVLLVDLSNLNHTRQHPERYREFERVEVLGVPRPPHIERFLRGLDVVFVCETPLNYYLFERARRLGVRTILQPNHEFNDYLNRPQLAPPDLFALPSTWHWADLDRPNKVLLRVPVATERLPQHQGGPIRRFLHVAGRPAVHDRNGTQEAIEAFALVACPEATLTIRVQGPASSGWAQAAAADGRISIDGTDVPDYWEAYRGFDCLIMPRKYGGLCLPMQEALGCGIPVIMPAISPNLDVLPPEWLVPAKRAGEFVTRSMIGIYAADVEALAAKIDALCSLGPRQAAAVYHQARELGQGISWRAMAPTYRRLIDDVAQG